MLVTIIYTVEVRTYLCEHSGCLRKSSGSVIIKALVTIIYTVESEQTFVDSGCFRKSSGSVIITTLVTIIYTVEVRTDLCGFRLPQEILWISHHYDVSNHHLYSGGQNRPL